MASDPKSNARYNPLTRTFVPNPIVGESKTVAELEFLPGVYGFWLDESPSATAGVTVKKGSTTYIVTNGGASGIVAPGEVYVDFSEMLGLCIFEDSEDGETFTIDYSGLGAPGNKESIQAIENAVVAQKLNIDGSNAMTGNLNAGSNNITNLLESSLTNNAVSNARLETRLDGIKQNIFSYENLGVVSGGSTISIPSAGTWLAIMVMIGLSPSPGSFLNDSSTDTYYYVTSSDFTVVGSPTSVSILWIRLY